VEFSTRSDLAIVTSHHVQVPIHLRPELADGATIHADPSGHDHGFGGPPGCNPCVGQVFLQPDFHSNPGFPPRRDSLERQGRSARLTLGLGLDKTGDAVAALPLAAFLEQFHPFKTLQNGPFRAQGCGGAETSVL